MVLSEIATGVRERTVVATVDVRRVYFHAPSSRRVFVELSPEDYQARDEHCCKAVAIQLVRHKRFHAKLGRGACFDTQQPQYDERYQVPLRSERLHQE